MPPCSHVKLPTVLCVILFPHHTDYNVAPLVRVHIATYYVLFQWRFLATCSSLYSIAHKLHYLMTLQFLTCQLYIFTATVG